MPTVHVSNGFSIDMPGLGAYRPVPTLSEKRITKAVREVLRDRYGIEEVWVSCDATRIDGEWVGRCGVGDQTLVYRIAR